MISTRRRAANNSALTRKRARGRQWIAAGLTLSFAVLAALLQWWPFDTKPPSLPVGKPPSLAQFFLQDRLTLGFVRLAIAFLTVFVVISIPALVVDGRWIKGFGTGGLPVDDPEGTADELRARLMNTFAERDEAIRLLKDALMQLGPTIIE